MNEYQRLTVNVIDGEADRGFVGEGMDGDVAARNRNVGTTDK